MVLNNSSFIPKYFIFLNSSVRGPFIVSYYDNPIWYTIFTRRLNDDIKLVGSTINFEITPHVQSYIWALDFEGLQSTFKGEIGASQVIRNFGFGIDSLMKKYQNIDFRLEKNKECNNMKNPTFTNVDQISLDPFEVVFIKIKDQFTQYQNNRERVRAYEKWIN